MTSAADQFQWHARARLFDGRGREQHPVRQILPVIADRPSTLALALALAAAGQGFRIGGTGPAPPPGAPAVFETLTSGSTGTPRRIRRTQRSWIASFGVNAGLFDIAPGASVAVLGRLVQSLSLYAALEGLHLGADVHLLDDIRADRQAQAVVMRGATHLYATPAQLRQWPKVARCPDLRHIIIGGSKLDARLRENLSQVAPHAAVWEFYGAAETSFVTITQPATPEGSVGAAYPGTEIDIRSGEIWVRSPYLFTAYASDPGSARWDGDWLSVGEMGHWDKSCLILSGRVGRMMTVADQNVFPEEIETFLLGLPGVRDAAVIPRPDPLRGQVLVAVLLGDRAEEPAILSACRDRLGPLKMPKAVVWRRDWPRLPSGKTDLAAILQGLS